MRMTDTSQYILPEYRPKDMTICIHRFHSDEAPQAFQQVLKLRLEVFVQEQQISLEEELDGNDESAWHFLMTGSLPESPPIAQAHASTIPVVLATGRLISYQEGCQMRPVAKLGRIAVQREWRGCGAGERLVREILKTVSEEGYEQVILDAQTSVLPFYEKLGFIKEGDAFLDANILHYRMRLLLP